MSERILHFRLTTTDSPFETFDKLRPSRKQLLNSTTWMGKEPRSCAITQVSNKGGANKNNETIWNIEVTYRPKGFISFVGDTKYDAWTALILDQTDEGVLLDGKGEPLGEGQPPVYIRGDVYGDIDFNALNLGDFVEEVDGKGVKHISHEELESLRKKSRRTSVSENPTFMAARRHRPSTKIILTNAPSQVINGSGELTFNISNSTPQIELVLQSKLTEVVFGFLEGRYGIKTMTIEQGALLMLSDSLVDCTPNEHGQEAWFDVLNSYVPMTFWDELAKRVEANFNVEVQVVDGENGGLFFKKQ